MRLKYFLKTFGCQLNKSDSERVAALLENLGYKETIEMKNADLLVFNTCSVRQSAEDRVFGLRNKLALLKKRNPNLKIVLTGCMIHYGEETLKKRMSELDIVLNIKDLKKLPEFLGKKNKVKFSNYLSLEAKHTSTVSANIPISFGCNNICSYCIVPYSRKKEYSRPVGDIINEVRKLIKAGYKEIWLLGQNVNSYKAKFKNEIIDFAKLLRLINNIAGNFWIRFTSPHPSNFSDDLIKAMKECKKCAEYVNLPVQSGDNEILEKMKRGYKVEDYVQLIRKIRKNIPGIAISTDVIVGFPGESKKQFLNTVNLFKKIKFDMAYISEYSPRPKTAAFFMKDDVIKKEKEKRKKILESILRKTALWNNKKYLGVIEEVLVNGQNRKGLYEGRTRSYKHVLITERCKKNLIGKFVKVKITKAHDFGLEGILI